MASRPLEPVANGARGHVAGVGGEDPIGLSFASAEWPDQYSTFINATRASV
jgi:hypothetical protein